MTEAKIDLARRAVACKGWRCVPGMLTLSGARILLVEDDGAYVLMARRAEQPMLMDGELPDFADAATLGCLLSLVREAWGDDLGCVVRLRTWCVFAAEKGVGDILLRGRGGTEAEALVAALEAAP